jgi:hypothetical protein
VTRAPASPPPTYDVRYYYLPQTLTRALSLFKRVHFAGRRRPETFAFDGQGWRPASGVLPAVRGTPEWDAAALPIAARAGRELVWKQTGWPRERIDRLFAGEEGQRLKLRG